ncbi:MAG: glycosyltransferase family 2 protein [Myxococcota bacterium]
MERSRTSIAMATCNGGHFIAEQLASLASQSRPPDQLVVCDDHSEDDTLARVEAFREGAPFEVLIERNSQRLGPTANFERAVSLCEGDVILLSDQDDVWLPEKIETLVDALAAHPEWGLAFCNGRVMDSSLKPLGYDLWQALFFDSHEQAEVARGRAPDVFMRHVVAAGNTLAFRSHFREILLPFPDLPSTHDAWIAFVISCLAGAGLVPEELIHYRLHGENLIGIHRFGWLDQLRQARRQLEDDAFGRLATFFEAAQLRLQDKINADLREAIEEKIAHCRTRADMRGGAFERLPNIYAEWKAGRYARFSYGLKSVAQDIWLR